MSEIEGSAERCPLCDGALAEAFETTDVNRRISREEFVYDRCQRCGLISLRNPPIDLSVFYEGEYHGRPSIDAVRHAARREHYQIELVNRHASSRGRLVEVGPALGVFALQAREAGFHVTAIEMDAACCEFLSSSVGVEARCTAEPEAVLPQLPPSRVIAMWQVVEHLRDPWACLDAAASNLEPDGILVVATPNPLSLGARVMGSRWPHVDAPRHVWLVPPEVLEEQMNKRGLVLESLTTSDLGARRWNRFAWQRLVMNSVPRSKVSERAAYVVGTAVSVLTALPERVGMNGSSYTAVFRKPA